MQSHSILVNLPAFKVEISEYDQVVRTISNFAVGREGHRTPIFDNGSLSLTKRQRDHVSTIYPPPNGGAHMPFALFFEQDLACAFHAGDPAIPSHGCIHLEPHDAEWLFNWAGSNPVGLTIQGPYPASPVPVQRTYKMGAPNMLTGVVMAIQTALKSASLYGGAVSGDFDLQTDEAVRQFQTARGLAVDGVVGPNTARALDVAL